MSNFLNQDFGSDEEDDDFNPVAAEESDVEDAKVSSRQYGMVVRDVSNTATMNSHRRDARVLRMPRMM
jgi:hypothetical protein